MIKDVFTLKKGSYLIWLMKYIWRLDYRDFSHMCPFFWLSILNHFAILVVFPIKEGGRLSWWLIKQSWKPICIFFLWLERIIEAFDEHQTAIWEKKRNEKWAKKAAYFKEHPELLVDQDGTIFDKILNKIAKYHSSEYYLLKEQTRQIAEKIQNDKWIQEAAEAQKRAEAKFKKNKEEFLAIFQGNIQEREQLAEGDGWINYLTDYKSHVKQKEIEAEADRRRANKERINRILRISKPIMTVCAYILGGVITSAIIYYLYKLFKWINAGIQRTPSPDWPAVWHVIGFGLKWAGFAIIAGLFLLLIIYISIQVKKHSNIHIKIKLPKFRIKTKTNRGGGYIVPVLNTTGGLFVWIWRKFIIRPFKAIGNGFQFTFQMIKNNCPAIKWED